MEVSVQTEQIIFATDIDFFCEVERLCQSGCPELFLWNLHKLCNRLLGLQMLITEMIHLRKFHQTCEGRGFLPLCSDIGLLWS